MQTELERLANALREPQSDERFCQFYAAQQALAWALDPVSARSPFDTISDGQVQPLILDKPEEPADCLDEIHPLAF